MVSESLPMENAVKNQQRSANMRAIRAKDTAPELSIRSMVYRMGYRFRLHQKDLPGKPDLVFPARRKVIFVHGCFWHQHVGCRDAVMPKSREGFWYPKLTRNAQRDSEQLNALKKLGWKVLIVWECELTNSRLSNRIRRFLGQTLGEQRRTERSK